MAIAVALAFNGFIFSAFVIFFVLRNIGLSKKHLLFLMAFFLNLNLNMLFVLLGTLDLTIISSFLYFSPIPFYLLSGPFIYLYTCSIIHNNQLPKDIYKHFFIALIHFIPLLSLFFTPHSKQVIMTYFELITFLVALPFFFDLYNSGSP